MHDSHNMSISMNNQHSVSTMGESEEGGESIQWHALFTIATLSV